MEKFLVVVEESVYSDMYKILFYDALKLDNVYFIDKYLNTSSSTVKKFYNILYSNKVNKILKYRFESIISCSYMIDNYLTENTEEDIFVIFMNASLQKFYTYRKLLSLKNKYSNLKLILFFLDPLFATQSRNALALAKTGIFDGIYSFDKNEANANSFKYWNTPYSKLCFSENISLGDVYFCGSLKGREKILNDCANVFKNNNIKFGYDIFGKTYSLKKLSNRVIECNNMGLKKYSQVIKITQQYDCILDIVQEGQQGLSLRPYEAVLYNKKLITNNPEIFNFQYYSPQFMLYFEDASKISTDWLNSNIKVDYNYEGEFSPINFLNEIKSLKLLKSEIY